MCVSWLREDTNSQPVLGSRMVLVIKAIGTEQEKWKGRFVCRGFTDPYKNIASGDVLVWVGK